VMSGGFFLPRLTPEDPAPRIQLNQPGTIVWTVDRGLTSNQADWTNS
jgi:hypothetical protein